MTIAEVIAQAKKVRDELAAGRVVGAGRATLPLQEFAFDMLEGIGIKETATDEQKAEFAKVSAEITELAGKTSDAAKIGDGAILKLLVELFLKFGPIFL